MSRAALLPTPGDPILLNYWLNNFEKYWIDEVDHLYIYINTTADQEAIDYMRERINRTPKTSQILATFQVQHGDCIDKLLSICQEEYVMLCEDDSYIFKHGKVNDCFQRIESGEYDIVGSKRASCSTEITDTATQLWGLDNSGYGDSGVNFWPCFLFSKKETLLKTDRDFKAKSWQKGETIIPLNHICEDYCVGDTFVNTSLQLRAMDLRFWYEQQYHGSPHDIEQELRKEWLFNGISSWTHAGSLSSGFGGALKKNAIINPDLVKTDGERLEWERRIQWWQIFLNSAETDKIKQIRDEYEEGINRVIYTFKLSKSNIKRRIYIYKELGL